MIIPRRRLCGVPQVPPSSPRETGKWSRRRRGPPPPAAQTWCRCWDCAWTARRSCHSRRFRLPLSATVEHHLGYSEMAGLGIGSKKGGGGRWGPIIFIMPSGWAPRLSLSIARFVHTCQSAHLALARGETVRALSILRRTFSSEDPTSPLTPVSMYFVRDVCPLISYRPARARYREYLALAPRETSSAPSIG